MDSEYPCASERHCLVFGITSNLAFALGSFIIGFKRHHPDWKGMIHVIHDGLSVDDKAALQKIHGRTEFDLLDRGKVAARINEGVEDTGTIDSTISRYSTLYFAKFEMFDLLQIYEKCIWFDVDMTVLKPMPNLWDFDELAWRPVTKKTALKHSSIRDQYSEILLSHNVPRPNAGLICASRKLFDKYSITSQTFYDVFAEIIRRHKIVTGDEFSLMLTAAKFKVDVKVLSNDYNCPSGSAAADFSSVIHSVGEKKFWNDGGLHAAFPEWAQYYREWINNAGSEYSGTVDESFLPLSRSKIVAKSRNVLVEMDVFKKLRRFVPDDVWPAPNFMVGPQKYFITGAPMEFWVECVWSESAHAKGAYIEMTLYAGGGRAISAVRKSLTNGQKFDDLVEINMKKVSNDCLRLSVVLLAEGNFSALIGCFRGIAQSINYD